MFLVPSGFLKLSAPSSIRVRFALGGLGEVKCDGTLLKWSVSLAGTEFLSRMFASYGHSNWQTGSVSLVAAGSHLPPIGQQMWFCFNFSRAVNSQPQKPYGFETFTFESDIVVQSLKPSISKISFIKTLHLAVARWFKPGKSLNSGKLSRSKPLGSIYNSFPFLLQHPKQICRTWLRTHVLLWNHLLKTSVAWYHYIQEGALHRDHPVEVSFKKDHLQCHRAVLHAQWILIMKTVSAGVKATSCILELLSLF